jgi:hypothetical protein
MRHLIFFLLTGAALFAQLPAPGGNGSSVPGPPGADGAVPTRTTVSFSATPVFVRTTAIQQWTMTLTGNVTSSTTTGLTAGDLLSLELIQDTTPRTIVMPTGFPALTLCATSGSRTTAEYFWTGSAAIARGVQTTGCAVPTLVTDAGNVISFTDATDTVAYLGQTQTFTGPKVFNDISTPGTNGNCVQKNALTGKLETSSGPCGSGGGSSVGEWTSTIDFGNIVDLSCLESTFTATGLTTGTPLLLVPPAAINTSLTGRAWASAADTAKVQLCNTSGGDIDPASASFTVKAARGYLSAAATIDFSSICAGCSLSNTVTVTGATTAFGAEVSPPSALASGLLVAARVTAANTVTISIFNATDADIDPASGSFTAMVIQ